MYLFSEPGSSGVDVPGIVVIPAELRAIASTVRAQPSFLIGKVELAYGSHPHGASASCETVSGHFTDGATGGAWYKGLTLASQPAIALTLNTKSFKLISPPPNKSSNPTIAVDPGSQLTIAWGTWSGLKLA